jgi:hypothetical protein
MFNTMMTSLSFLTLLGFIQNTQAAMFSVKTEVYCEQKDDADKWYAVGIIPSIAKSGKNIIIVKNTYDDDQKILIADKQVFTSNSKISTVYKDKFQTIELAFKKKNSKVGTLSMLFDGSGSFANLELDCYHDGRYISYESATGIEPRLGVGN